MKRKLFLLAILAVCAVGVMIAVIGTKVKPQQTADFVPPAFDRNAVTGIPDLNEDQGFYTVEIGSYTVSFLVPFSADEDTADVQFTNYEINDCWMKLRLLDHKDHILGETGLIKPGEYVETIALTQEVTEDTVKAKFLFYEPEIYYSAGVALTEVPVIKE